MLPEYGYTPANLLALREKHGLTQTQLGELAAATQRTIARWETPVGADTHADMPLKKWLMLLENLKPFKADVFQQKCKELCFAGNDEIGFALNGADDDVEMWLNGTQRIPAAAVVKCVKLLKQRDKIVARLLAWFAEETELQQWEKIPALDYWDSYAFRCQTERRIQQSAMNVLAEQHGAGWVSFEIEPFQAWLGDRVDSDEARWEWAAKKVNR